jgi:hypothetical protein
MKYRYAVSNINKPNIQKGIIRLIFTLINQNAFQLLFYAEVILPTSCRKIYEMQAAH